MLFLIFRRFDLQHPVAGFSDRFGQSGFIQDVLAENLCDPLLVRRGNFFDLKVLSNRIIDMALTHRAHHSVDFHRCFYHHNLRIPLSYRLAKANTTTKKRKRLVLANYYYKSPSLFCQAPMPRLPRRCQT